MEQLSSSCVVVCVCASVVSFWSGPGSGWGSLAVPLSLPWHGGACAAPVHCVCGGVCMCEYEYGGAMCTCVEAMLVRLLVNRECVF